jgi:hypothetical protein
MKDKILRKTNDLEADNIDELSVDYEDFGYLLRKQTAKVLLKKGGPWVALGFKFRDLDGPSQKYGPEEVALAAFKSRDGTYKRYSYFIVRDKEMAEKIIDLLKETFDV